VAMDRRTLRTTSDDTHRLQKKISPDNSEEPPGLVPDPATPKSYRIRRGQPSGASPGPSTELCPD